VFAESATLQALLEGVSLPASKRDLIRYARSQDADGMMLDMLKRLPDREFSALDEVGEELAPVQPDSASPVSKVPREESDAQPGGEDYVNPRPASGAVRSDAPADNPPQKALERQAKLLKEQQERQQKLLGG
jgi:hypothetical protein